MHLLHSLSHHSLDVWPCSDHIPVIKSIISEGFVLFYFLFILLTALIASLLRSEMSFKCIVKVNLSPHQKKNREKNKLCYRILLNIWSTSELPVKLFKKYLSISVFLTYDSHLYQKSRDFVIENLQYRWSSASYHRAFSFSHVWST